MSAIRVNKLRVGSFAKVVAITQAILAFIYGLIFTVGVAGGEISRHTTVVHELGISLGLLGMAVIIFPIVGYIVGWVQGAVAAMVLNLVFRESGGLELEVEDVK